MQSENINAEDSMKERFERMRESVRERVGTASVLEVLGRSELLVTGCVALCDFDSSSVYVETVSGLVSVFGECLEVCAYRADLLCVKGRIERVEFGGTVCS